MAFTKAFDHKRKNKGDRKLTISQTIFQKQRKSYCRAYDMIKIVFTMMMMTLMTTNDDGSRLKPRCKLQTVLTDFPMKMKGFVYYYLKLQ